MLKVKAFFFLNLSVQNPNWSKNFLEILFA